jgi:hypothetical protein
MHYLRFKHSIGKLFFYTTTDNWGTPEFKVALRTTVNEESTPTTDTFTIGINGLDSSAFLRYLGEFFVAVNLKVPTKLQSQT